MGINIAILLYDGITALDAVGPYEVLSLLPDVKIQFVAKEISAKRTDTGFLALAADYQLDAVPHPDVVLIPGSSSNTASAMADQGILDWIRSAHESSQWTVSVCSGALILGAAGVLKGKKATTHWFAMKYLVNFGAEPTSERIVQQGKIITAAGVSAGIDMALYLVGKIAGDQTAHDERCGSGGKKILQVSTHGWRILLPRFILAQTQTKPMNLRLRTFESESHLSFTRMLQATSAHPTNDCDLLKEIGGAARI